MELAALYSRSIKFSIGRSRYRRNLWNPSAGVNIGVKEDGGRVNSANSVALLDDIFHKERTVRYTSGLSFPPFKGRVSDARSFCPARGSILPLNSERDCWDSMNPIVYGPTSAVVPIEVHKSSSSRPLRFYFVQHAFNDLEGDRRFGWVANIAGDADFLDKMEDCSQQVLCLCRQAWCGISATNLACPALLKVDLLALSDSLAAYLSVTHQDVCNVFHHPAGIVNSLLLSKFKQVTFPFWKR